MVRKTKPEPDPESCGHCHHWQGNDARDYGYCRRFPPAVVASEDGPEFAHPVTECSETCGEFKRRLNS